MSWVRAVVAAAAGVVIGLPVVGAPVSAADPVPPFIGADADWLTTVNYYRAMANLPTVIENGSWSQGSYNHSCYMLYNGISHDEIPGRPGYTSSGDEAGNSGNVAVSSAYGASARSHIELWMTGPFHAIGILRHNLASVGFGKCDNAGTSPWKSAATLDVIRGINSAPRPATPTVWPGNGTTTNLSQFVTESPNPLTFCGWSGTAGLPVIALMPEPVTSATASITGPNGPVETCRIFSGNTSGIARDILAGDNAVSVIPRAALAPGTYTVTVTTQARSVTWSFTVDPTAATGIMPAPAANPVGGAAKFTPVSPFRFVDSRENLRATRLLAGVPKRVKMAGSGGIPADATAVSINLTAVSPQGYGFITVYPCTTLAPTSSSINYVPGDIIANSGTYPLSAGGELCFVSKATTEFIIDVSGYYRSTGSHTYSPMTPTRLVDTRIGQGGTRLPSGGTLTIDVSRFAAEGDAVNLSLVEDAPSAPGYLTAWPCGSARPIVSNLNYTVGQLRSNLAQTRVGQNGQVCLYAHGETDVVVDIHGVFQPDSAAGSFQASEPFRLIDTREPYRSEMQLGFGGQRMPGRATATIDLAGVRGIPSNARAVVVNLTVVDAVAGGFVTVWPCGPLEQVSTMNYSNTHATANAAILPVTSGGKVCLLVHTTSNVIVDVAGWWA